MNKCNHPLCQKSQELFDIFEDSTWRVCYGYCSAECFVDNLKIKFEPFLDGLKIFTHVDSKNKFDPPVNHKPAYRLSMPKVKWWKND